MYQRFGRNVFVTGEIEEQLITLINVYNPPGKAADLLKRILSLLDRGEGNNLGGTSTWNQKADTQKYNKT